MTFESGALPRTKVCGITTQGDLELAIDAGAGAVGFVHHRPSCRHLPAAAVANLVRRAAGRVATVLVVADAAGLPDLLEATGADAVQLCGSEPPSLVDRLTVPVLRRLPVGADAQRELGRWRGRALGFVLDHPSAPGGSGLAVEPGLAARLARQAPCLLAGGLGPETVHDAIQRVRPLGVDASSGLESSPGIKSPEAIARFVSRAEAALSSTHRSTGPS